MATAVRMAVPETLARELIDDGIAVPARSPRGVGDVVNVIVDGIEAGASVLTVLGAPEILRQLISRARRLLPPQRTGPVRVTVEGPAGRRTIEIQDGASDEVLAGRLAALVDEVADPPA